MGNVERTSNGEANGIYLYRVILSLEAPNKFGKSIPEFGETHSSVLGCERRPVSASIMSRSCFASFLVCVYKFSSYEQVLFCIVPGMCI